MITCDDYNPNESSVKKFFTNKEAIGFYEWCDWPVEKGLERLVFQVSRKPGSLEGHLERIYYCFQNDLNEQLFGALVDLLIVLNNKGLTLGKRMVLGARAKLTEIQFRTLTDFLENNQAGINSLTGNRYSVFSKGFQPQAKLLEINEEGDEKAHDPLVIARDYIEFSQLEEAINVLEEAVMVHYERIELHQELLSLYRSTRCVAGFNRMYKALSDKHSTLPPGWKQLDVFFLGMNSNEK